MTALCQSKVKMVSLKLCSYSPCRPCSVAFPTTSSALEEVELLRPSRATPDADEAVLTQMNL